MTLLQVYRQFEEELRRGQKRAWSWCNANFVSYLTMQTAVGVAGQFLQSLLGFLRGRR